MAYSMGQMFLSLDWTVNNVIACPLADVVDSWSCRRVGGSEGKRSEMLWNTRIGKTGEEWYSTKLEELDVKL